MEPTCGWLRSTMLLVKEDMDMHAFDFSPLFRSTIGFDRLSQLVDAAMHSD